MHCAPHGQLIRTRHALLAMVSIYYTNVGPLISDRTMVFHHSFYIITPLGPPIAHNTACTIGHQRRLTIVPPPGLFVIIGTCNGSIGRIIGFLRQARYHHSADALPRPVDIIPALHRLPTGDRHLCHGHSVGDHVGLSVVNGRKTLLHR